jgi:hypothetical protein
MAGNSNSGGARRGAGRPPGARDRFIIAEAKKHAKEGMTPLQFFLNTMRNPKAKWDKRFACACQAAPLMHGRIGNISPEVVPAPAPDARGDNVVALREFPRLLAHVGNGAGS